MKVVHFSLTHLGQLKQLGVETKPGSPQYPPRQFAALLVTPPSPSSHSAMALLSGTSSHASRALLADFLMGASKDGQCPRDIPVSPAHMRSGAGAGASVQCTTQPPGSLPDPRLKMGSRLKPCIN